MNTSWVKTPLLIPAALLSGASLTWTTWSLVDLLGAGHIGITVAAGADIIWASVILAEARGLTIRIKDFNIVPAIGWASLVLVGILLAWHGIDRDARAMAVAGPLLPLGAKVVWLLALADMRDPADFTDGERAQLADEERAMRFEEVRHQRQLRRREMAAEHLLAEVSVDFEIELARLDKGRELARRAPIAIAPIAAEQTPITIASTPEHHEASGRPEPGVTSAITDREQASIIDLARDQVAITPDNATATKAILALRPKAKEPSVSAAVRRARQEFDAAGGYR
ncbi:hypothetical protein [Streptomyces sp. NPDC004285]